MRESPEPLVSVIVATHNQAAFLPQCLASLVNQTLGRSFYEVVVVDDGSTDDTPAIIAASRGDIDTVVTQPYRMGLVPACNAGLEKAVAPWIIRVDSDDWLDAGSLELLTAETQAVEKVDIVIPAYWIVEGESVRIARPDIQNVFTWMAGGPLLRREAVVEAGGYREFYWEEYDLYLRMLSNGAKVKGITAPVLYHRKHGGSMTARLEDRALGWQELVANATSQTYRIVSNVFAKIHHRARRKESRPFIGKI